jgi:very-short-patch-repair endonuclease
MRGLRGPAADRAIAALAERQDDVVARRQLIALRISSDAIDLRLAAGRLRRVFRGVYAVGRTQLTNDGWSMAAVLLVGEGAALSHRTAAAHVGILRWRPARADITVSYERRPLKPVRLHYGAIEDDEITTVRGIACTGLSRTLFDLAGIVRPTLVAATMKEADVLRLTDKLSLPVLLARYPRKPGVRVVRQLLADYATGLNRTRSDLEIAFLEFLRERRLPLPETNVWLEVNRRWIEADCVWREQKLIAELDGREAHMTTHAFEDDRGRDRAVLVSEWRSFRVTWRMVHQDAAGLEADIRILLRLG